MLFLVETPLGSPPPLFLSMKRLIIYDLDGTLVDTGEDIAQAVNHMLRELTGAALSHEEIRRFVGSGLHDLVARCLKTQDPDVIERGMALFGRYYAQHLTDHSRLYPGAKPLLEYFRERTQVLITNKPLPFARDLIAALEVAAYFAEVIAPGSPYPKKPDPTAIVSLMARYHLTSHDVLLIGDSLIDIQTGRNAGVLTAIVQQGFANQEELKAAAPDLLTRDLHELLALARQQGW